MSIIGGLDIHRKQLTFDCLDTVTGEAARGRVCPADREHLRAWLARFAGRGDVAFAFEGCTGWRYVAEEMAAAGIEAHLAEPADTASARGRKRRAKTDKTDSAHLRQLLAEGRLPECWVPPGRSWKPGRCWRPTTTCAASTPPGCSGSTRSSSTRARPALGEITRTAAGTDAVRAAAAAHLSAAGQRQVAAALATMTCLEDQWARCGSSCRASPGT